MVPALAQDRRCAHGTDVGRLGRGVRPGPATILPDLDALGAVLRDATAGRHGDRRDRRECKAGRAPARRRSGYRDLYHLRGTGLAALLARPQPGAAEPELRPDRHRHEGSCGPRARQGAARTRDCRRRAAGSSRAVDRFLFGPPVGFPVQFRVVGPDPMKVRAVAEEVRQVMAANAKIVDPHLDWSEQVKSIRLEVDQDRARALGLTPQDVAQTLQTLLSGYTVTQFREGIEHIDVVAR